MSRVVVCGSLNMDVVVQSARRPAAGETLTGAKASFLPGGKGLNQAVAAARTGVPSVMIGAIGEGPFGNALRTFLADNDVDCTQLFVVPGVATGLAFIQVAGGDNAITVASGANALFAPSMVDQVPQRNEVWVAQLETPPATTAALFVQARAAGARTVLNMAPMVEHSADLLKSVEVAVLNEIELAQATNTRLRTSSSIKSIVAACRTLRERGARAVVATLGARGVVVVTAEGETALPGLSATVVDTTGAGDCFVGAFAACLARGQTPVEAAHYANAAASCSVEKLGAAPSMPTVEEVATRLARP
jgi:ribokinase